MIIIEQCYNAVYNMGKPSFNPSWLKFESLGALFLPAKYSVYIVKVFNLSA